MNFSISVGMSIDHRFLYQLAMRRAEAGNFRSALMVIEEAIRLSEERDDHVSTRQFLAFEKRIQQDLERCPDARGAPRKR